MTKTPSKTTNTGQPLRWLVGQCYLFMRRDHAWHSCEVAVISITGNLYTVARVKDVCAGLLTRPGSKKRKLKTWTCKHKDLL